MDAQVLKLSEQQEFDTSHLKSTSYLSSIENMLSVEPILSLYDQLLTLTQQQYAILSYFLDPTTPSLHQLHLASLAQVLMYAKARINEQLYYDDSVHQKPVIIHTLNENECQLS